MLKYFVRADMVQILKGKPGEANKKGLLARWASFDTRGSNMPSIQPNTFVKHWKSLVGKELRTVLQTAPFVLFHYISKESRHLWSALVHLCSFIFQHKIPNMDVYLTDLTLAIDIFFVALLRCNARWCNKPKFHQLVHLVAAIRRWGPAFLFSTDRFESFNKVLRIASILSNHQAPGRDIAVTFASRLMLAFILSGGSWLSKQSTGTRVTAGRKVLELFQSDKDIRASFGLNIGVNVEPELSCKCE